MTSRTVRKAIWPLGFAVLTAIATVRIVSAGSASYQTNDEPFHVACGMWWTEGLYPYSCVDQPPLARVAAALPLRLAGVPPAHFSTGIYEEGSADLRSQGAYERNLALARSGILPFFWLASLMTWLWARRLFGEATGLAAAFFFEGLPLVLGHAGLATTDMAITALLVSSLYLFVRWLERPGPRTGAAVGAIAGLAVLAKHSAVLFLPATFLALAATWYLTGRTERRFEAFARQRANSLGIGFVVGILVIWAGYRFGSAPLASPKDRPHRLSRILATAGVANASVRDAVDRLVELPVPAGLLAQGVALVHQRDAEGVSSYFFGEFRKDGSRLFFPTMIGVKTPLAYLVLVIAGCLLLGRARARAGWEGLGPAVGAGAILLVDMSASFNLGARHVLPAFPMLSILAAWGLRGLARSPRGGPFPRWAALGLVAWFAGSSARAHPGYLAYFNELVSAPERIVVDSDLEWGQDVKPLLAELARRGADGAAVRCLGCKYLWIPGLPPVPGSPERLRELAPYVPQSGWVAVSEFALRMEARELRDPARAEGPFDWLEPYPYTRIGKSIRLYEVPARN